MEYISVEQARELKVLRLVLCAGTPGVWGEAIKAVLDFHGLSYVPVRQDVGRENQALQAWTGQTSAPVIVDANDKLHISWESMILHADSLSSKSLIPADPARRAWMFGLLREVAGENGIGWNRRLQSFALAGGPEANPIVKHLAQKYGYSDQAVMDAEVNTVDILRLLSAQLEQQKPYFFGEELTALDFYVAIFIGVMINPLSADIIPMPEMMRAGFSFPSQAMSAALDENLLRHRDLMFAEHIKTPLDF